MKKLLWKIRFSLAIRRLLFLPWPMCWWLAGANLEGLKGDTSECPEDSAEAERDAWEQSC